MILVTIFVIGLLGLAIGSFLNVVILRSLAEKKLTGRSECPHCHHQLGPQDLIPVFSYLFLRGKCRYCHKKISSQYPLVEVSTSLLFLVASYLVLNPYQNNLSLNTLVYLAIQLFGISVLIAVFTTDLLKGLIPNRIIVPSILILVVLKVVYLGVLISSHYLALSSDTLGFGIYLLPPHSNYLFGLLSGYASTLAYDLAAGFGIGLFFYLLVLFSRGRAMGGGDIKLGFFVGLLGGFPYALVTLLIAFTSGAMISLVLLMLGKKKFGQTIPFGPFLVLGSLVTLFWGPAIFNWYIGLLG